MGKKALEGIKVVDFGWVGVAPRHTKYLADHGATVIRVESHTRIDNLRLTPPFKGSAPTINNGAYFSAANTSKYGISLDTSKPKGREIGLKLLQWADVAVEGFTPGTMKKAGLDYESARRVKPDIIYLSTCQQGQSGPHAMFAGFGNLGAGVAGLNYISGWADRDPIPPHGWYMDYVAPRFGCAAILAALDHRRRTGKGVYLDLSQVETVLHFLSPVLMDYFVNGRIFERSGNSLPYAAPHGVYPCKGEDRWVAIAVFTDKEWDSFCKAIGNPPWIRGPLFSTLRGRKENEGELNRRVGEWTPLYSAEEIETLMQKAGIACSVVQTSRELLEDPQVIHRRSFRMLEHPVIGVHGHEAAGFILSATPSEERPAPCLGQHNEYVYRELLKLADDEIADLYAERVITTEDDLPPYLRKG